jgi:hypothetical protein
MRWCVLYRDGSTFTDAEGEPRDAPRTNVQMVFQEDERAGATTAKSSRGYWVWEGAWIPTDDAGLFQHLFLCREPLVLFGSFLSQDDWHDMKALIAKHLGICKSAWYASEREPHAIS